MSKLRWGGFAAAILLACGGGSPNSELGPVQGGRVDGLVGTRTRMLQDGGLVIASEKIDDALLAAILDDPRVPQLRDLELFDNALTVAGVWTIVGHIKTSRLRWLQLSSNAIGDDGLRVIAASPRLGSVERLFLAHTGATSAGAEALAASPHATALAEVDLGYQAIGDTGARALTTLRVTTSLLLKKAEIAGEGARSLIAGGTAPRLVLDDNTLGAGALAGLSGVAPTLTSLSLARTGLGPGDAEALAALPAPALRVLSLEYCAIGDSGVFAITRAPWFHQLDALNLSYTRASVATYATLKEAWGARKGLSAG